MGWAGQRSAGAVLSGQMKPLCENWFQTGRPDCCGGGDNFLSRV